MSAEEVQEHVQVTGSQSPDVPRRAGKNWSFSGKSYAARQAELDKEQKAELGEDIMYLVN